MIVCMLKRLSIFVAEACRRVDVSHAYSGRGAARVISSDLQPSIIHDRFDESFLTDQCHDLNGTHTYQIATSTSPMLEHAGI